MEDKSKIVSTWVDLYTSKLLQWAIYKLKDRDLAQDLVQDTFAVAFETFDQFKHNSKPLTWLVGILNNKINTQYRTSAKFTMSELQAEKLTNDMFVEDGHWSQQEKFGVWQEEKHLLDNPAFIKIFDACTSKLPDNWREALFQKYIFEKDSNEICQELNLSDTNYWQLIHRSKLLMRKCIEKFWGN